MLIDEQIEVKITGRGKPPSYYTQGVLAEIKKYNLGYEFLGFAINESSEWAGAHTKLVLKCPKHGEYSSCSYNNFTKKNGKGRRCPVCSVETVADFHRDTLESFIHKANLIHNNFYDYSKSIYVNANTPLVYTCPLHGEQTIRPSKHILNGQRCNKCALESILLDSYDVKNKINEIHDDHFTFDEFVYKGRHKECIVTCKIKNQSYKTKPNILLMGHGCSLCHSRSKFTKETFIKKAKEVHGNLYVYDDIDYVDLRTEIEVFCTKHSGYFKILPTNHIHGHKNGCSECAGYGYNRSKPGFIYVQKILDKKKIVCYKYGITGDLNRRIMEQSRGSMYVHEFTFFHKFEDGNIPWDIENKIKNSIPSSFLSRRELESGHTETFSVDYITQVNNIIERYLEMYENN
ncbi:GIY-YIG nuclease family protein [Salmonella enterica]|uniref:GIY-YIG nuclease family protein n=1 Tax=Salmonella enterica TaxID=28901 RepID=UPI003A81311A